MVAASYGVLGVTLLTVVSFVSMVSHIIISIVHFVLMLVCKKKMFYNCTVNG